MIHIKDLKVTYPGMPSPVLNRVSVEIPAGSTTLITGLSGSGKSTFLRCLNGLVPHFSGGDISGEIRVFGKDPIRLGPEKMASEVGFVFQEPENQFIFTHVEDEIAFTLENTGMARDEMHHKVDAVMEMLQLQSLRGKRIEDISGGEKQLVAIAAALIANPRVLILDEPTSQLDAQTASLVLHFLKNIRETQNLITIIAEHRMERLINFVDAIGYLSSDGQLIFGQPRSILKTMPLVPPIIEIAKKMAVSPLPLDESEFPKSLSNHTSCPSPQSPSTKPQDRTPILTLEGLSASLDETPVLKNVHLNLQKGEIMTIVGPNGSGKTTLLRAILGLIPSEGVKKIKKIDLSTLSLQEIIKNITYLPQNPNDLLFAESIFKEMTTTLRNHHMSLSKEEILAFLSDFNLDNKSQRYPRDLSVGERQRTALAAVTIHQPEVIILDEPTRGLDYREKEALFDIFKTWRAQDRAILCVTHDLEFAARISDRVSILEMGAILFTGDPHIGFSAYPKYRTQTARLFPKTNWIIPSHMK